MQLTASFLLNDLVFYAPCFGVKSNTYLLIILGSWKVREKKCNPCENLIILRIQICGSFGGGKKLLLYVKMKSIYSTKILENRKTTIKSSRYFVTKVIFSDKKMSSYVHRQGKNDSQVNLKNKIFLFKMF